MTMIFSQRDLTSFLFLIFTLPLLEVSEFRVDWDSASVDILAQRE